MVLGGLGSAVISADEMKFNLESGVSWLDPNNEERLREKNIHTVIIEKGFTDPVSLFSKGVNYPNVMYAPESIFLNQVGMLDVDFLSPVNEKEQHYSAVTEGGNVQTSASTILRDSISRWYVTFRDLAIVLLLSVLVYIGIRILLSSTAPDKAKYKERLKDWLIGLCLVFTMHFIMAGILTITNQFNSLFSDMANNIKVIDDIENHVNDNGQGGNRVAPDGFITNLTGLVRYKVQAEEMETAAAHGILYIALIGFTLVFTMQYIKRVLYMAFFTMIAPLVALTYPIDKMRDGKAQAFNMWFKEYTMNAIIQPIHLILYSVLIGSAMDLATENIIYALVALGFMMPAEKFIKKMFGVEAQTGSDSGSFAKGAITASLLSGRKKSGGKSTKSSGSKPDNEEESRTRFANTNSGELSSFNGDSGNLGTNQNTVSGENSENSNNQENTQNSDVNPVRTSNNNNSNNENEENVRTPNNDNSNNENEENVRTSNNDNLNNNNAENGDEPIRLENGKRRLASKIGGSARRTSWKAAKGTVRGLARGSTRLAGTAGGLMAGLAAGAVSAIVTGDASRVAKYGAAGAFAGNALGRKAFDGVSNTATKIPQGLSKLKYEKDESLYGAKVANENREKQQNIKARNELMKDPVQKAKYERMKGEIGYSGSTKNFMDKVADYKEAGVNDDKLIKSALDMENVKGFIDDPDAHRKVVDVTSFASNSGYNRGTIEDEKKRTFMEANVLKAVGDDESKQRAIMETFAEIHGLGDTYKGIKKKEIDKVKKAEAEKEKNSLVWTKERQAKEDAKDKRIIL